MTPPHISPYLSPLLSSPHLPPPLHTSRRPSPPDLPVVLQMLGAMVLMLPRMGYLEQAKVSLHASLSARLRQEREAAGIQVESKLPKLPVEPELPGLSVERGLPVEPELPNLPEEEAELTGVPVEESELLKTATYVHRLSAKCEQLEREQLWLVAISSMRREAVAAVMTRLTNHALFTLMKLTDLANTKPLARSMGTSPRLSKKESMGATIFSSPPILPFLSLGGEGDDISLAEPPEDCSAGGSFHRLFTQSSGMTIEQMKRLCVAQHFWPARFDSMSSNQQRQVC